MTMSLSVQNTPEKYQYALELLKSAREVGSVVTRRGCTFFSALAINQNQPEVALEVLSLASQSNYITVRNLRIMALTKMGRLEDVFPILRLMLNRDDPLKVSSEVFPDTVTLVYDTRKALTNISMSLPF
jgi:hypothetical protein